MPMNLLWSKFMLFWK